MDSDIGLIWLLQTLDKNIIEVLSIVYFCFYYDTWILGSLQKRSSNKWIHSNVSIFSFTSIIVTLIVFNSSLKTMLLSDSQFFLLL